MKIALALRGPSIALREFRAELHYYAGLALQVLNNVLFAMNSLS